MDLKKKILYHYTTEAGMAGILESKCLWATHFKFKNDLTELFFAKEVMLKFLKRKCKGTHIAERLGRICDALWEKDITNPFLFSFSDDNGMNCTPQVGQNMLE